MLVGLIRENKIDEVIEYYKKNGLSEILSAIGHFVNRGSYYSIDLEGNIKRKEASLTYPILNKSKNMEEAIKFVMENCIAKENFVKNLKIERMAKCEEVKLEENFFKTLLKGETSFALKYGKEIYLRDKVKFEKIFRYIIILLRGKEDLALLFENVLELFEKYGYKDEIFYNLIDYAANGEKLIGRYEDFVETGYTKDLKSLTEHIKNDVYSLYYLKNGVKYFEIVKNKNKKLEEFILREIEKEEKSDFTDCTIYYKKMI